MELEIESIEEVKLEQINLANNRVGIIDQDKDTKRNMFTTRPVFKCSMT